MKTFNKKKKTLLRDKSRDRLAEQLNALGVQAEMKDRGQPEAKVGSFWIFKRSLGVIDVKSESIKLIIDKCTEEKWQ